MEHHHEGAGFSVSGDVYGSVIPHVYCGTPPWGCQVKCHWRCVWFSNSLCTLWNTTMSSPGCSVIPCVLHGMYTTMSSPGCSVIPCVLRGMYTTMSLPGCSVIPCVLCGTPSWVCQSECHWSCVWISHSQCTLWNTTTSLLSLKQLSAILKFCCPDCQRPVLELFACCPEVLYWLSDTSAGTVCLLPWSLVLTVRHQCWNCLPLSLMSSCTDCDSH